MGAQLGMQSKPIFLEGLLVLILSRLGVDIHILNEVNTACLLYENWLELGQY